MMVFLTAIAKDVLHAFSVVLQYPALHANPDDLSDDELLQTWSAMDHMVRRLSHRKDQLRVVILARARSSGKNTKKGGHKVVRDGFVALRKVMGGHEFRLDGLIELLESKKLPLIRGVTTRIERKTVADPSKIANLVDTGYLTQEEIEPLRIPAVDALDIYEADPWQDIVEGYLPRPPGLRRKGKQAEEPSP